MYFDDFLTAGKSLDNVRDVKRMLMNTFDTWDLGMEVHKDMAASLLKLSHTYTYSQEIVACFKFNGCQTCIFTHESYSKVALQYRPTACFASVSIYGSDWLSYLSVGMDMARHLPSRGSIAARYMSCPPKDHWDD